MLLKHEASMCIPVQAARASSSPAVRSPLAAPCAMMQKGRAPLLRNDQGDSNNAELINSSSVDRGWFRERFLAGGPVRLAARPENCAITASCPWSGRAIIG